MSPLRWIQSTGPHWTVMLEEVTSDTLTEEGGADGASDFREHGQVNYIAIEVIY